MAARANPDRTRFLAFAWKITYSNSKTLFPTFLCHNDNVRSTAHMLYASQQKRFATEILQTGFFLLPGNFCARCSNERDNIITTLYSQVIIISMCETNIYPGGSHTEFTVETIKTGNVISFRGNWTWRPWLLENAKTEEQLVTQKWRDLINELDSSCNCWSMWRSMGHWSGVFKLSWPHNPLKKKTRR